MDKLNQKANYDFESERFVLIDDIGTVRGKGGIKNYVQNVLRKSNMSEQLYVADEIESVEELKAKLRDTITKIEIKKKELEEIQERNDTSR